MNDVCVCAEPLVERGLYPCGHALCLSCTLKQRVLMKDMHCPYCRSNAQTVAVLGESGTEFSDAETEFRRGHLRVQNDEVRDQLQHILRFPCPECDEEQQDLKRLKKHLLEAHNKVVCDVCVHNEYQFSDEYITYAPQKIKEHLKRKHIFCKYCHKYLYGAQAFASHCKKEHVSCDICERRDPEHPQYFEHFNQLRNHYQDSHFRCMEPECLANLHIVFGTALELQKHMVEAHHMSPQAVTIDYPAAKKSRSEAPEDDAQDTNDDEGGRGDEESRYFARLEIVAEHDTAKVEKIKGANKTFLARKVPVDVFVATYDGVLKKDAQFVPQITALLTAFSRAYGAELTPSNLRALNFKLYMREQAEQKQADSEKQKKLMATGSYAQRSGGGTAPPAQPARKGPAPRPIETINWGHDLPRLSGVGNLASLPKLGGSQPTPSGQSQNRSLNRSHGINLAKPSSTSTSVPSTSYASVARPAVTLANLPKLEKKSKPQSMAGANRPGPSMSSPAIALQQTHLNSSLNSLSVNQTITSSGNQRGVQLDSLPSLPKAKKKEAKRQHNVIRIR